MKAKIHSKGGKWEVSDVVTCDYVIGTRYNMKAPVPWVQFQSSELRLLWNWLM